MPNLTHNKASDKDEFISKMRKFLKDDSTVQEMFAKKGLDIDIVDFIPIMFGKIDVSAKTDHGIIILNNKLLDDWLKDKKSIDQFSYGCHECTHFIQQCFGEKGTQSASDGSYLDNPYEQEAFQNQVKFLADNDSEDKAINYVDDLLDHHDVNGKDREKKKDILLSDIIL